MALDIGDVAAPTLEVRDLDTGALIAAGSVSATVLAPDGTALNPTVVSPSLGLYEATWVTTQAGAHAITWTVTGAGAGVHRDEVTVRPSTTAVVSLPQLRQHLAMPAPDPVRDEQLRDVLDAATELCEVYTDTVYRPGTVVTETHDGGAAALILRRHPVQAITTVTVDGTPVTDWILGLGGVLRRAGDAPWPGGPAAITLTYTAGAPVVPARIVEAVLVTVEHLWATRRGGSGLPKRSGSDSESTAAPWALPRRAEQLLNADIRGVF